MGNAHDKRLPGYPAKPTQPTIGRSLKPPPSGGKGAPFDAGRCFRTSKAFARRHENLYSSGAYNL